MQLCTVIRSQLRTCHSMKQLSVPWDSLCFSAAALRERCPPRRKSRGERLKAKAEPLSTQITVDDEDSARAEYALETPTQCHISPSILRYEDNGSKERDWSTSELRGNAPGRNGYTCVPLETAGTSILNVGF